MILSSVSGSSAIAPGSLATLYGIKLSTEPFTGQPDEFGQLPTQLGGYSLEVNGMLAQLQFVGPSQVNFVVPSGAQIGKTNVNLRVSDQVLAQSTVNILPIAPSVFTYIQDGSELGAVVNAVTFQRGLLSPETSAIQGCDKRTRLAIYATGMGFSSNRVRMRDIRVDAQDSAGTVYPFDVVAAQAAPGLVGVDQLNVILPAILKSGQFKLRITANGVASNWVRFDLGARDQTLALANRTCLGGVQIVRMPGDPPAQFSGTVSLAFPAPSGGVLVDLQSGEESVAVPGSVVVAEGQVSAGFQMTIASSRPSKPIKVTATLNGDVRTAVFEDGTPCVNGVALSAPGVVGGMSVDGIVQLTDAAPDGGVVVNLLTDNPAVQANSSVRVQGGRMSAPFTVDTSKGVVPSAATISAVGACGGSSVSLSVVTAPCVTGIALSASAITGGAGATGTVTLNSAALTGGLVVLLKSNDPAVQVPAQVTIPAGQSSAAFTLTSKPVMARTQAVIMASVGDCGASAGIIVNP